MTITTDITFNELLNKPEVTGFRNFLLSNCDIPNMDWSLKAMQEEFYDWVADSIAHGLSRLFTLIEDGVKVDYDFYTAEEKRLSPDREGTKLFFFPGKKGMPFVMICPGGGYTAVCTLKEGFTTAARLNELGYNAFILSYRVKAAEDKDHSGITPKALDDMAAAMRFIECHADLFGVSLNQYAVSGFSSGGHLAGEWATKNVGARSYGIAAPTAVFLGYPASDTTEYHLLNGRNPLLERMVGSQYTEADVEKYNVNAHIDENYPVTYLWHCKDDDIIPIQTSYNMMEELKKHKIPFVFKEVEHGGHGFGLGEYGEANGWLEEAIELWERTSLNGKR